MSKIDAEIIERMKHNFALIEQSLSEHLSAINENTAELQSFFDYIQELDQKLEKLSQRLDQIQLQMNVPNDKPYVAPLNPTEKKLFLVLYTEEAPLNCFDLSQKSGVPCSIIREYLATIVQKGVPLNRSFQNSHTYYQLSYKFKEWRISLTCL